MASQQGCWEWPYRGRSYSTGRQPFPSFPARLLSAPATPTLFSVYKVLPFQKCWLGAIGQNVVFSVCSFPPVWFSMVSFGGCSCNIWAFLFSCCVLFCDVNSLQSDCSSSEENLGYFYIWGILNKVAVYTYEHFNVSTVPGSCDGHKFIHSFLFKLNYCFLE